MKADLKVVARNKLAEKITGGLSITDEMPSQNWGTPATRCKVDSLLAQQEGTVCNSCYALKGCYGFGAVKNKREERYQGAFNPHWTPAMVHLVRWYCDEYFRWIDSGEASEFVEGLQVLLSELRDPRVSNFIHRRLFSSRSRASSRRSFSESSLADVLVFFFQFGSRFSLCHRLRAAWAKLLPG